MTTTKQYDFLNRLTQIASAPSAPPAPPAPSTVSFNYIYNTANQRIRSTLADGSYWLYAYDALGQVTSGKKYWSDSTPVAGQQFEYGFDGIGNRTSAKAGGDQNGANLRSAGYSANSLNQYTTRDVPGAVDIMGLSFATNTVTVNNETPYRKGEYFRKELLVDNNSTPLWTNITVDATNQSTVSGHVFVPQTQEQFGYDADGNLTSDGRWTYTWDGENRLLSLTARTNIGLPQLVKFEYDPKGRRNHKQVWNDTDTNNNAPVLDFTFVYDGWNLIAELNATNNAALRTYTWGLDLSGSPQAAGGVGGLIAVFDPSTLNNQPSTHFAAYDGNGNVSALVNAGDGSISAQYEYGPFGELLRATGPMAKANPFRFSTKYEDDESDVLYYGYRYYNASMGSWTSRDPFGEEAFKRSVSMRQFSAAALNAIPNAAVFENQEGLLFVFVGNDPMNSIDLLGLCEKMKCGLAVDQALRLTRADVLSRFSKLGFWGKARACAPIWFPTPGYAMAWDMEDMTWYWRLNMPCGKQPTCDQTVTVGGKCYNAWDVNYMLYGWAASLCGMNLSQTYDHVILWKIWNRDFARLPGALGFSTLGWFGTYSPLPPEVPPIGYPSCDECSLTYSKNLTSKWP